jgi:High potential iron-sulfur protein
MAVNRPDKSRRTIIQAVAGGVSASLLSRIAPAEAEEIQVGEKQSLAQAQYQDTPNGIYSCGNCSLFEPPKSCKVVAGDVSEDGWCKAFALAD